MSPIDSKAKMEKLLTRIQQGILTVVPSNAQFDIFQNKTTVKMVLITVSTSQWARELIRNEVLDQFQFRRLNIKGTYVGFPISIRLFSNHLYWNSFKTSIWKLNWNKKLWFWSWCKLAQSKTELKSNQSESVLPFWWQLLFLMVDQIVLIGQFWRRLDLMEVEVHEKTKDSNC